MLGDAPRKLSNCYKQTETVNTHTRRKNSENNVIEALLRKETENAETGEGMKFSANGMCTFDRFHLVGGGERWAGEQKETKWAPVKISSTMPFELPIRPEGEDIGK